MAGVTSHDPQLGHYRRLGAAFARGGERYERLRPEYPSAAVDWLTEGVAPGAPVADIGAGTGKLTGALVSRGLQVTAVDPSDDMLRQLQERYPEVAVVNGTGERTGLPDHGVHLATFAQSWHWVEPEAGTAELIRILTTGGRAAALWNHLDEQVDWVAALVAIWHSLSLDELEADQRVAPTFGDEFPTAESTVVDWAMPMTQADLADLVTTRSYYLDAAEADRARVLGRVRAHLADVFGEISDVQVPYQTFCYRSDLTG